MAKLRTCKICGKQYEYCGHCPSKNTIEPWRNLYCSENCRDAFQVMGQYSTGKMKAAEARGKLESFGLNTGKVREIHKAVVADIFRASKSETPKPIAEVVQPKAVEEVSEMTLVQPKVANEVIEKETRPIEVKIADDTEKLVYQKNFKKKSKNIVNED